MNKQVNRPAYIIIPGVAEADRNLHPNAKILLGYIVSLSTTQLGCIAHNNYFASALYVSVPTVKRYLKQLKELGYIEVARTPKNRRIITPSDLTRPGRTNNKVSNSSELSNELAWVDDVLNSL